MSRDNAYTLILVLLVAAVLLTIPLAFVVLWWLHVRQSRRRPEQLSVYGWILLVAPPAIIVGVQNALTSFENGVSYRGYSYTRPWEGLGEGLLAMAWTAELLLGWVLSLAAELPTREMRRRILARKAGRLPASDQNAGAAAGRGDASGESGEQSITRDPGDAAEGSALGDETPRALPPFVGFVIGALAAVVGLWPYCAKVRQPGIADYASANGPLLFLPFDHDLGLAVELTYGVILTGAGVAAVALRYARSWYRGTDVRDGLMGVLTIQGLALPLTVAAIVGDQGASAATAVMAVGALLWIGLGILVFHAIASGPRTAALIAFPFVAVAVSWWIAARPLTRVASPGLLGVDPDRLVAPGLLLGIAIVWVGFDTVRKVQASAVAIGINWVLCTALGALPALTPRTKSDLRMEGPHTWAGEFVANLLTPTTLFFTIAVPMAVAALGIALRQFSDVAAPAPPESAAPPKIRTPR